MSIPKRVRARDRLYILAEILDITLEPTLKTQIMYKANLSFRQLNEYISKMLELQLLEIIQDDDGKRTAYKTTKKGLRFLNSYNAVRELLRTEQIGEVSALQRRSKQR